MTMASKASATMTRLFRKALFQLFRWQFLHVELLAAVMNVVCQHDGTVDGQKADED